MALALADILTSYAGLFGFAAYYMSTAAKGIFAVGGQRPSRFAWYATASPAGQGAFTPDSSGPLDGGPLLPQTAVLVLTARDLPGVIGAQWYYAQPAALVGGAPASIVEVYALPGVIVPEGLLHV